MKRTAEILYSAFTIVQYLVAAYFLWYGWNGLVQNSKDFPVLIVLFFFAIILGQKKVPLNANRSLWMFLSDPIFFLVLFAFAPGVVIWFTAVTDFCLYGSLILLGTFRTRSWIFPMTSNIIICFGVASLVFRAVAGGNLEQAFLNKGLAAFLAIILVWVVVVGVNLFNLAITFAPIWRTNFLNFLRSLPDFIQQGDLISTLLGALLAILFRREPMAAFLVAAPGVIFALSNEGYARTTSEFAKLMEVLLKALESSDPSGYSHSQRVALYSREISIKMGKTVEEAREVYELALIHDLGTLVVPDHVLFKQDRLSLLEWEMVHRHPLQTSAFVKHLPRFKKSFLSLESHHERFDGLGYPRGLKGGEIPLAARIIAAADAYDAMTNDRPFRKRLSKEVALRRMWRGREKQFDPEAVQALFLYLEEEPSFPFESESALWVVTEAVGMEMDLSAARLDDIYEAVTLHELNPPSDIFSKPGEASSAWWQVDYREHVGVSDGLRRDFPTSEEALKILWNHHEWLSEAPAGASALVESRILAASEAFVSCLGGGMDWPLALVRLKERVGTQFDPDVIRALESVLSKGKLPPDILFGVLEIEKSKSSKKAT